MRIIRYAIPLIAALLVSGCGKETDPASAGTSANPGEPKASAAAPTVAGPSITAASLDAVARASRPYKIALIVKTRNNPFFSPMIQAFQDEAKTLGVDARVESPQQETDKEKQFDLVTTVASAGVNAILITPADSRAIVPALKQAQDKGVLVINIDNRIDAAAAAQQGLNIGGYVGADNEEGGKLAAQAMVKRLGNHGEVAVLEGIRGADNAEARKRGFEHAKQQLDVVDSQSANWDTEQAYSKMSTILANHADLDGVFCSNDDMALGAIQAIKQAGKTGKVTVVGYDDIPAAKRYLADGELYATIEQHPDLMGKYGLRMAVGLLDGTVPKGSQMLVNLELIKGK